MDQGVPNFHANKPRRHQVLKWDPDPTERLPTRFYLRSPFDGWLHFNKPSTKRPLNKKTTMRPIDTWFNTRPLDKRTTMRPEDEWFYTRSLDKRTTMRPIDRLLNTRPLDKRTTMRPVNKRFYKRPSNKRPIMRPEDEWLYKRPFNKKTTMRPLDMWSTLRPLEMSTPVNRFHHVDRNVFKQPDEKQLRQFEKPFHVLPYGEPGSSYILVNRIGTGFGCAALFMLMLFLWKREKLSDTDTNTRQDSNEQSAANVNNNGQQGLLNNDCPPSYSECVTNVNKNISEELPPCYVSNTDPEDDEPQHIRRQNILDNSSTDNVQNDLGPKAELGAITTSSIDSAESDALTDNSTDSEDEDPPTRAELVFENGRIVERLSLVLNTNSNETEVASNDDVEEDSTRDADFKDRVEYVDEIASEFTTSDTEPLL